MSFQPEPGVIRWRMHLRSPPQKVYAALAGESGRAAFWAEAAPEVEGVVTFRFPDGQSSGGRVLAREEPSRFALEYFGSTVEFHLVDDGHGGTDLSLIDRGVAEADRCETAAGWVSVLMAMKAAVDHGVDLRNHDGSRSWRAGYADN
jgi:uncharacterized protein YndB with AHSA1/START domain